MGKKRFVWIGIFLIILLSTVTFTVLADRQVESTGQPTLYSGDVPGHPATALSPAAGDSKWSEALYYNIAGVTFRPRSSSTTWESMDNCLYAPSGAEFLNTALLLPEGSVIEYLYLDYYNTSTDHADVFISQYNERGIYIDLISLSTTLESGFASEQSAYIGVVVDNATYSYAINFRPNNNSDAMRLCGVRVAYKTP